MPPLLLEINTRCWLGELSAKAGQSVTLASVPDAEVESWRALGFTHIWLMGVWRSGPRARAQALASPQQRAGFSEALPDWREEDVVGSPYAIAEYRVLDRMGGEAGLKAFRARLKALGMKLVLDFVPNHFGIDCPWLASRPELFVHADPSADGAFRQSTNRGVEWLAHGRDPNFPAWADTVQLDYRREETRAAMIEILKTVAAQCDGVRCDMAMLVLNAVFAKTWPASSGSQSPPESEFWSEAITAVRKSCSDFLFLAEAYWGLESRLQALGFDFAYDKTLYDLLVLRHGGDVQRYLLSAPPESLSAGAHFLENHDEPRFASLADWPKHRAAALVILGLPGLRFLHEGQLAGWKHRAPVQLIRRAVEPMDPEVAQGYRMLLDAVKKSPLVKGPARVVSPLAAWPGNPTLQNFILVHWESSGPESVLMAVNYASHQGQCYVPLALPEVPARNWIVRDRLSSEEYVRQDDDLRARGLYLDLVAYGSHLFDIRPAE